MFNLKYLSIVFFILTLITEKYKEVYTAYDITTRLNINVFFWDLFYFSWTNISYIFTIQIVFIILFYASYYLHKIKIPHHYFILIYSLITILYFIYNSNMFLTLNYSTIKLDYYNTLLSNSLNKYHPFILYMSWVFILALFTLCNNVSNKYFFYHQLSYDITNTLIALYFILFTLLLGSWWAYQEGSWGGWWNWDPSEVFGLYIMLLLSLSLHSLLSKNSLLSYKTLLYVSMISSIIYYCFMQINFSLISHNFGFRDSDLIDIRLFYLISLFWLSSILIFLIKSTLKSSWYLNLINAHPNYSWYRVVALFILFAIITTSLFILLNDLIWKVIKVNVTNLVINYNILLTFLFLVYFSLSLTLNLFQVSTLIVSLYFSIEFIYVMFLLNLLFRSIFVKIHKLILLSVLLAIIFCRFYMSNWLPLKLAATYYDNTISYLTNYNFGLHYPFLFENLSSRNSYIYTNYLASTSPDLKMFNLLSNSTTTTQSLTSDHGLNSYLFSSYDKGSIHLLGVVLIYLLIARLIPLKPKLILI